MSMDRPPHHRALAVLLMLALLLAAGLVPHSLAQSDDDPWSDPINLSQSGAAEQPQIVTAPDGTIQVFWWDRFDGIMSASFDGEAWSEPTSNPINETVLVSGLFVSRHIEEMPAIVADTLGWVYAFWWGVADRDSGVRPLMYSQMPIGGTTWSLPRELAESAIAFDVTADPTGGLTLAYVRALHAPPFPAGIYFKRAPGGGGAWGPYVIAYDSIYFRLLSSEETHVAVAGDGLGNVHLAWHDPQMDRALYARSTDDGESWSEPLELGDLETSAQRPWVTVGQEGQALLLWEASRVAAPCALYQQRSGDGGASWGGGQAVLEALGTCPEQVDFLRALDGQLFLVSGSGSDGLTLAAWDGAQWSEPRALSFSFEEPEQGRRVYLEALQVALVNDMLAVVGQGQDGEVWILESLVAAHEWAFAPPSAWSEPLNVSQSARWPGLPAMAADDEGQVHLLWSESRREGLPGTALYYTRWDGGADGGRWSQPVAVLQSPAGKADQPDLLSLGDRLHAVWSGGQSGEILYSWAYHRDAYAPGGWSEPLYLPAPSEVGSWPRIAADLGGILHVVYAVPLNEGRGIYYTRSEDGGESWSEVQVVFDAAAAGWDMADHPSLALDERGDLHLAWVKATLPDSGLPQGIYYARSTDRGTTWTEPWAVAEGAFDWPRVLASDTGQLHLLWNEASGSLFLRHRWTVAAAEQDWSYTQQVRGFNGPGPAALAADGAGSLHLAGLGTDAAGQAALQYATWSVQHWSETELVRLDLGTSGTPGLALAVQVARGRLDLAFRGETVGEQGAPQIDLFFVSRSIPAVAVTPRPTFTPLPSPSPTPTASPTATPTPPPTVNAQAPPPAPPSLELGPINLSYAALAGLALAVLLVLSVLTTRSLRRR